MSFATLTDYETAFPGTSSPDELARIITALDAACEDIRRYTNQTLDLVTDDTITLHGTGKQLLLLPQLPVIAVSAVMIDKDLPTEVAITDFRLDADDGILYRPPKTPDGALTWWNCPDLSFPPTPPLGWPIGFKNVTVTYDHGYDPVPQNLINIAVQLARNTLASPPLVFRGEKIGGYSYTRYENYEGVEEFASILDRYTINRIPVG